MNDRSRSPEDLATEVRRLAEKVCSETIAAEECDRLNSLLRDNPEAQSVYLACMSIHAHLSWEFGPGGADDTKNLCVFADSANASLQADASPHRLAELEPPRRMTPARSWRVTIWSTLGVLAATALLAVSFHLVTDRPKRDSKLPIAVNCATLTGDFHAQWEGAASFSIGQTLPLGRLRLSAGVIEVTFGDGAVAIVEGPAELEIVSPSRAFLQSGQAVVYAADQAHGFTIETRIANVVDLGTEFGVKAGRSGSTEVQVFKGSVVAEMKEANPQEQKKYALEAGRAIWVDGASAVPRELKYSPERFVRRLPDPSQRGADRSNPYNQSSIDHVLIVPAPRGLVIDGDLSDWNRVGMFRAACKPPYGDYYVEGCMMYDEQYLYIGAHVGDPAPMRNVVDPRTDPESAWHGGGIQVRLSTDRKMGWPLRGEHTYVSGRPTFSPEDLNEKLVHLTLWHYQPGNQDCLTILYGMDLHGERVNPPGYRGVFRNDPDGRGYVVEYAIPWTLLSTGGDVPCAGDMLGVNWNVHWSDDSGRLWLGHLVDILNPSDRDPSEAFHKASSWGQAIYAPARGLK
jgi:hypothetical protein